MAVSHFFMRNTVLPPDGKIAPSPAFHSALCNLLPLVWDIGIFFPALASSAAAFPSHVRNMTIPLYFKTRKSSRRKSGSAVLLKWRDRGTNLPALPHLHSIHSLQEKGAHVVSGAAYPGYHVWDVWRYSLRDFVKQAFGTEEMI